ncbi:4-alpha-glucanotransferase, partial [Acinetobacter baumannii]|nr:4-alpha-glucanotransferase [Acinetobacter baumannii]
GTGADGRWLQGPGIDFFLRAHERFGELPFIAEDLGLLTPAVRSLVASCGFPGMDVLEFADYDVRDTIAPHEGKILYTSTHDTSTLLG